MEETSYSSNSCFRSFVKPRGNEMTLQELCRKTILSCVTLDRLQSLDELCLPKVIKGYLCDFRILVDFDLNGWFINYNINFPNHMHHQTHQIHPGYCVLDCSKVLIKSGSLNDGCGQCNAFGNCVMKSHKEREKWEGLQHESLMKCFVSMTDPVTQKLCYVMEFPEITLQDLIIKVHFGGGHIPEFHVWKLLMKLTNLLLYLHKNGVLPWQLCQPSHVIINRDGEMKLENLLLYLPVITGTRYQTEPTQNRTLFQSPEQRNAGYRPNLQTLVWGLGCILYEIAANIPSILSKEIHAGQLHQNFKTEYSTDLQMTICDCLQSSSKQRPTLKALLKRADRNFRIHQHSYRGPKNILELCPDYAV